MNIDKVGKDIKKELRASMNGILSARMREAGMPFKLIFGVELPRLQNIAKEFAQETVSLEPEEKTELANRLWKQNIRETKLLAIMLMPAEAFTSEMSNVWAETMVTAEEAQVLAMMLLPKTNHAKTTCAKWLKNGPSFHATCACLCLYHLSIQGTLFSEEEKLFIKDCTAKLLPNANLHLRKAIQVLFSNFGF